MSFKLKENLQHYILFFSLFAILFAYYVEFVLGHKPCNLCLLERIPYILAILIIILSSIFKNLKKLSFLMLGIIFLLATFLSIYHVGIEQGIISESALCKAQSGLNILDKEQLLQELEKSNISCKNVTFTILGLSLATINTFVSLFFSLITMRKFYIYEKSNKKKIEEFIRVDHAGERGAIKIYEGQLLALNTLVKDDEMKKTIEEMREHEREHANYFENEIKKRGIRPTKFLPLWDLLGVGLGFGSTILGKKAAMLCTASVEEVIDEHYQNQIDQIENDEKELKKKIIKFREDELHHKDIAYEQGATKDGLYSLFDKIIKTGSRIAINISEKI